MRGLITVVLTGTFLFIMAEVSAAATNLLSANIAKPYRTDRFLIQPRPEIAPAGLERFHSLHHTQVLGKFRHAGNLQVLQVPAGETVESCISRYQQSGGVEFAEPDSLVFAAAAPNDPKFQDGTVANGVYIITAKAAARLPRRHRCHQRLGRVDLCEQYRGGRARFRDPVQP